HRLFLKDNFPVGPRQPRVGALPAISTLVADLDVDGNPVLLGKGIGDARGCRTAVGLKLRLPERIEGVGFGNEHGGSRDPTLLPEGRQFGVVLQSPTNGGVAWQDI